MQCRIYLGAAFLHMKVIIGVDTVEQKAFERSTKVIKRKKFLKII